MSGNENAQEHENAQEGEEAAPEQQAAGPEPEDESPEALRAALEKARGQAEENWNQFLRVKAELENAQRRSQQEVEKARKYGNEKLLLELLPVKDSLELGVAAAMESNDEAAGKFQEGAELTLKKLEGVFEQFGVQAIDPAGEKFDPTVHEAVSAQPSTEQAPNTVMSVIQKGYTLEDRLLRPAMVVVAKAPEGDNGAG